MVAMHHHLHPQGAGKGADLPQGSHIPNLFSAPLIKQLDADGLIAVEGQVPPGGGGI